MKKYLGLLLAIVLIIPFGVKALTFDTTNMCEKSCRSELSGRCEQTCYLKVIDNTTTLTEIKLGLEYSEGVKVKQITEEEGWLKSGTTSPITFTNLNGVSDSSFKLATIVFDVEDAKTDCSINFLINDYKVTYKEEVKKQENPSTGVSLPVVILLSGLAIAGAVYVITKKNTKMYKI